jgi:hypothetical protein
MSRYVQKRKPGGYPGNDAPPSEVLLRVVHHSRGSLVCVVSLRYRAGVDHVAQRHPRNESLLRRVPGEGLGRWKLRRVVEVECAVNFLRDEVLVGVLSCGLAVSRGWLHLLRGWRIASSLPLMSRRNKSRGSRRRRSLHSGTRVWCGEVVCLLWLLHDRIRLAVVALLAKVRLERCGVDCSFRNLGQRRARRVLGLIRRLAGMVWREAVRHLHRYLLMERTLVRRLRVLV